MRKLGSLFLFFLAQVSLSGAWAVVDAVPAGTSVLLEPIRAAFNRHGELLVTDCQKKMVVAQDPNAGTSKWTFAVNGVPLGIAYSRGCIYIGNETTKRVEVYDESGAWKFNLGASDDVVEKPSDIDVDPSDRKVFVVDSVNKIVKVYSMEGPLLTSFPATPDPALLVRPTAVTVDPKAKEVFVSDYGDPDQSVPPKVQVLNYTGNLLRTITGKQGMLGMRFGYPQGMALDNLGHLFLASAFSGEIVILDRVTGVQLKKIGTYGTEPGKLMLPLDVMVEPRTKDLYVVNSQMGRVEVYVQGGVLP